LVLGWASFDFPVSGKIRIGYKTEQGNLQIILELCNSDSGILGISKKKSKIWVSPMPKNTRSTE
jgi:hypothetical protein